MIWHRNNRTMLVRLGKDNKENWVDYKTGIRKDLKEGTSKRKRCRCILQKEKDIEVNIGERIYQDEENIHENEATQVHTENLGEEEKTKIQDILDLMKDNCRIYLRDFNKIDRSLLAKLSRKKNFQNWKYYWRKYPDKSRYSLCRKKYWP